MMQKCACGYQVDPERRGFCPYCGEKIVAQEPPLAGKIPVPPAQPVRDEPKKKGKK
jgi:DNA-directed RNA polymerase subunit RPC12/RpoP